MPDGSASAGFTTGRPWLRLGADHEEVNVAALEQDEASILHFLSQAYRPESQPSDVG
jgi:hypothetical protein